MNAATSSSCTTGEYSIDCGRGCGGGDVGREGVEGGEEGSKLEGVFTLATSDEEERGGADVARAGGREVDRRINLSRSGSLQLMCNNIRV